MSPAAKRMRRSLIVLVALLIGLDATVYLASANEVDRVTGNFCAWTTQHLAVDLRQPQTTARRADERSDAQLERKLGC